MKRRTVVRKAKVLRWYAGRIAACGVFCLLLPQVALAATVDRGDDDTAAGATACTAAANDCTLRGAIAATPAAGTVDFDPSVTTVDLTAGELTINKDLTITGLGANVLTVQRSAVGGTPDFRISTSRPATR